MSYRTMVVSMKRLYNKGKITKEDLKERVVNSVITEEEYGYITGEVYA